MNARDFHLPRPEIDAEGIEAAAETLIRSGQTQVAIWLWSVALRLRIERGESADQGRYGKKAGWR